nr:hypothetical protein [Gammaproteobacteria bacterium]NIW36991.1 hypothetical protein [Gemmatimonadota bacterium]
MVSREAGFLLNNWVFIAILAVVFFGTLFPVFSEFLSGRRMTWGPPFFNAVLSPFGILLLLLTGVGPLIAWRRASRAALRRQFAWPCALGLVAGLGAWLLARSGIRSYGLTNVYALVTWGLAAFVTATIVQEYARAIRARVRRGGENALQAFLTLLRKNQQRYGGYIVHLGVVLMMIGFAGTILNEERLENVEPGSEIRIRDYRMRYLTAEALPAQHYGGARARIALYRDDEALGVMTPE